MKYLMVLNDGETFSDLEGCYVLPVPDDWDEDSIKRLATPDSPIYCHPTGCHFRARQFTLSVNEWGDLRVDITVYS